MKNPEVDTWFEKKQHPMEEALQAVRDITLDTDDRITESIKWSTPTSYKGNIFSFNPAKKFVSLLFIPMPISPVNGPVWKGRATPPG